MIPRLQGQSFRAIRDSINLIIDEINANSNYTGDGTIQVSRAGRATSISANINQIAQRIAKVKTQTAESTEIHKAYCSTGSPAAVTMTCFIDTDTTGSAIVTNFEVAGGEDLDGATPRLYDGDLVFVVLKGTDWHCVTTFQSSQDYA